MSVQLPHVQCCCRFNLNQPCILQNTCSILIWCISEDSRESEADQSTRALRAGMPLESMKDVATTSTAAKSP